MKPSDTAPAYLEPDRASATPQLVKVEEACQILSLSRTSVHFLVADGKLKAVRIGRAVRFSVEHLREFIDAHSDAR